MNKISLGLSLAIFLQFLVLTGMYVSAALPLWTGKEIKVKTVPIDPRSLFRGNYARLSYEFSQIKSQEFPENGNLRNGQIVFIHLKPNSDGLYDYSGVSLEKTENAVSLRGRIANRHYESSTHYYRVNYGIEAFFAAKDKALELERNLRKGGVAVLMVSSDGKARLKEVIGG